MKCGSKRRWTTRIRFWTIPYMTIVSVVSYFASTIEKNCLKVGGRMTNQSSSLSSTICAFSIRSKYSSSPLIITTFTNQWKGYKGRKNFRIPIVNAFSCDAHFSILLKIDRSTDQRIQLRLFSLPAISCSIMYWRTFAITDNHNCNIP